MSTKKCLAILLRCYSSETKKVCDSLLGLVELDNGSSAAGIYEVLRGYLVSVGVNWENLAGFAADNCLTMMGQLNGVQSILLKTLVLGSHLLAARRQKKLLKQASCAAALININTTEKVYLFS